MTTSSEYTPPLCPVCNKPRPYHLPDCEYGALIRLTLEMWNWIWRQEGCPSTSDRCNCFEYRIQDFVGYLGSSHFPSASASSRSHD